MDVMNKEEKTVQKFIASIDFKKYKEFKALAALNNKTVNQLINELIFNYLEENTRNK